MVVDALFGTGLARAPEGEAADAIRQMLRWRAEGVRVLAVDLPSGLSSDTGRAFEPCVAADLTVTFGARKLGLALEPGATLAGCVEVVDIGLAELTPSTWLLEPSDGPRWLPPRRSDTNKGTYGHLLVVAGSRGKSGAAALAGLAALRSGVGLCTVATPVDALSDVQGHAPELMGVALPAAAVLGPTHLDVLLAAAEGKDALVIGPGIPRGSETHALLGELLARLDVPGAPRRRRAQRHRRTSRAAPAEPRAGRPHPASGGDGAARRDNPSPRSRRTGSAPRARSPAPTARWWCSRERAPWSPSPGDSSGSIPPGTRAWPPGGTGDVLSGMIGAFLAQGLAPVDAASVGVLAHGLGGRRGGPALGPARGHRLGPDRRARRGVDRMGTVSFSSASPAETRALGEALGRVLQEGDFVGLVGELGAGKTELARGIARGVGIRDEDVTSPTFAIVHQHHGRIPLTHADLYRLTGPADLDGTGFHELRDGPGATLVEWVDRVPGAAPPDALRIVLEEPAEDRARAGGHRLRPALGASARSGGRTSCSAAPAEPGCAAVSAPCAHAPGDARRLISPRCRRPVAAARLSSRE